MAVTPTARLGAVALLSAATALALASARSSPAPAVEGASRARAVVVVDDGTRETVACVRFREPIDGIEALRRSGSEIVTAPFGSLGEAVCAIDGTGCSASACLTCQAPAHWNYLRAPSGSSSLAPSPVGASSTKVRDGDVEAWVWGSSISLPDLPSVESVCGPTVTSTQPAPTPPDSSEAPAPQSPPPEATGGAGPQPESSVELGTTTSVPEPEHDVAEGPSRSTTEPAASAEPTSGNERAGSPQSGGESGASPAGLLAVLGAASALGAWAVLLRLRRPR